MQGSGRSSRCPDFEDRTPFFGKSEFIYDAMRDEYRCPQGQPLPRRKTKYSEQEVLYRADAAICNACPVKAECTASDHGRMVHRSFYADYLDRVRSYHDDRGLPEGDAQAEGLGRTAVCRGEGVARLTPAPVAGPAERQHPGAPGCGRAEPEALPGGDRMGPAPRPLWELLALPRESRRTLGRLRRDDHLDENEGRFGRSNHGAHARAAAPQAFFNRLGRYRNQSLIIIASPISYLAISRCLDTEKLGAVGKRCIRDGSCNAIPASTSATRASSSSVEPPHRFSRGSPQPKSATSR